MTTTRNPSSHGKLIAVVSVAAALIVLSLVSAFGWPGWALRSAPADPADASSVVGQDDGDKASRPSIKATALPDDASALLKAMPDSVLDFARTKADPSSAWAGVDPAPLEEYTLVYSTGKDGGDVTVTVGQWSSRDDAKQQYDRLAGSSDDSPLASGNITVSGAVAGSYVYRSVPGDGGKAQAVWQNDTVVFQATGDRDAVGRLYRSFPM